MFLQSVCLMPMVPDFGFDTLLHSGFVYNEFLHTHFAPGHCYIVPIGRFNMTSTKSTGSITDELLSRYASRQRAVEVS